MFIDIVRSISKFGYYLLIIVFTLMFIILTAMPNTCEPTLTIVLLTICALAITGAIVIYD